MKSISMSPSAEFLFAQCPVMRVSASMGKIQKTPSPDSLRGRWRRVFCFDQEAARGLPLVQTGYASAAEPDGL